VTSAVAEHFAGRGIDFAGIVLIAGFTDVPSLLTSYAIGGWVPILSPLRRMPRLQKWFSSHVVDKWPSAARLANFVRWSKKARLFIIHATDDYDIPWLHSEQLFAAAANATTEHGMDPALLQKVKARTTIEMGDGAFVSTWKVSGDKFIREEIVSNGRKSKFLI
jgi:abhydrolase domain-containing protein 12